MGSLACSDIGFSGNNGKKHWAQRYLLRLKNRRHQPAEDQSHEVACHIRLTKFLFHCSRRKLGWSLGTIARLNVSYLLENRSLLQLIPGYCPGCLWAGLAAIESGVGGLEEACSLAKIFICERFHAEASYDVLDAH